MAEFKDASLWMRLAFLMVTIGLLLDLHGLSSGVNDVYGDVRGTMVIAYLCFLVAFVLALCLIFLDELKGNKAALICLIVFALIAGLAVIIGVALWGGNSRYYSNIGTYPAMLLCMAGLLDILGGIFAILEIAGVKG
ncbi:hypothetical protein LSH36_1263g00002 [Paralvinella palmiformis]|uniref:Uncharacterized protein n=1 Tax=Paralvinella palmiformis TaxID=53620 RepID=A0AAD9MNX3_9ANNE|nr:hypothetical protein LSH36_1263g00002 [Paralvinella palmiformis]